MWPEKTTRIVEFFHFSTLVKLPDQSIGKSWRKSETGKCQPGKVGRLSNESVIKLCDVRKMLIMFLGGAGRIFDLMGECV